MPHRKKSSASPEAEREIASGHIKYLKCCSSRPRRRGSKSTGRTFSDQRSCSQDRVFVFAAKSLTSELGHSRRIWHVRLEGKFRNCCKYRRIVRALAQCSS